MELSKYQIAIAEAVQQRIDTPKGETLKGLLIEALAGTGKSFMLVEICRLLREAQVTPDRARLVVFGKKNKADLAEKLAAKVGGEWKDSVSTLHSLSFQILREALNVPSKSFKIESWKYRDIASELKLITYHEGWGRSKKRFYGSLFSNCHEDAEDKIAELERDFVSLLELLRLYCLPATLENLEKLARLHGLEIIPDKNVSRAASQCLEIGLAQAISTYYLDYTDMSWVLWMQRKKCEGTLEKYRSQFRMLAVDEAQDTDLLQLNVLSLLVDPVRSFLVAVGDRHQAVYSFRGCISDGLDKFQEQFNCEILPLPVNYRCGRSHLELVRKIFPNIPIEAHPKASEGEIKIIQHSDFLSLFADESLNYIGVCRKNAPLIFYAIKLLAAGKPAKIKDKSLGKKITEQVDKICKKFRTAYDPQDFPQLAAKYEQAERDQLSKYDNHEKRIAALQDMLQAVLTLFENYEPQTFQDWDAIIDKIFDESDGRKAINLYSIHSGKGGEGDVAFILNPENMPLVHKNQTLEEREQENNLLYVALTRPRQTLALVVGQDSRPSSISWLPKEYLEVAAISEPIAAENLPPEISQEELLEVLGKLEKFPREKLRTVLRELVDRLGQETVKNFLEG